MKFTNFFDKFSSSRNFCAVKAIIFARSRTRVRELVVLRRRMRCSVHHVHNN